MAALAAILIFCLSIKQNFADDETELTWPVEYHVKTEQMDLMSGSTETMEIWWSATLNRSRIDYYGGMTKSYYVWPEDGEKLGVIDIVFPYSSEVEQNGKECIGIPGALREFLPKTKDYEYAGKTVHEGVNVRSWKLKEHLKKHKWLEYTLYTRQARGYDVPVQWVRRAFLDSQGMLAAHVITNYFNFSITADSFFNVSSDGCWPEAKLGDHLHTDLKFLHPGIESHVHAAFNSFKNHHEKQYTNEDENELRKHIFARNWALINHHNRLQNSYRLQVNQFADLTPEERASLLGTRPSEELGTHAFPHSDEEVLAIAEELPENFDMRLEGYTSNVKNQGSCGSCWAFAATAAAEGALARGAARALDLSEQSLVDCAWGFSNYGCMGGQIDKAFRYILKHGIPIEDEYGEYLQQNGYCHRDNMTELFRIQGFAMATPRSAPALRVALYKYGPAATSINFSDAMTFYSSGVFYDPTCNNGTVNHGVTVVGYGRQHGAAYWLVRNSYGPTWGADGHFLLSADNDCFLLDEPFYAVV